MEIQLNQIKPNPFRDLKNYPIDREKVETLKGSIDQTGFWDNVLVRPGEYSDYQLAYGHHRLIALQELYPAVHVIDIPVKDLSDATMIQIMANENMDAWHHTPAVINETVRVVRDYLNAELDKYDSWEEFQKCDLINLLEQKTEKAYNKVKSGVGQGTITTFLGKAWKQHRVQDALYQLDRIEAGELDAEVINSMGSTTTASRFAHAVVAESVPVEKQKEFADEVLDDGVKQIVPNVRAKVINDKYPSKKKAIAEKAALDFNDFITGLANDIEAVDRKVEQLISTIREHGTPVNYDRGRATNLSFVLKKHLEYLETLKNLTNNEK